MGELTRGFAFVFANVSVEQESPPTFYFILRKGLKSTAKTFEIFLGFGELIIEREGISTLSIHGYPWALSYLLRSTFLISQLFEMVLLYVWV